MRLDCTGDTPGSARTAMTRRPPHILVTTPESLYLLLTSAGGRGMLADVSTVIIDGRWVMLHRPKTEFGGAHGEIVLSRSADLISWSAPEQVLQPRDGAWWDSLRIGIGPPPLWTEHGWLLVYHGVKDTVSGQLYRVGLALLRMPVGS